jgi:Txe/YoeB family toxin of Txe-Axe toxin-antitoxin module
MKLTFTEDGWSDYLWFQETDRKLLKKLKLSLSKKSNVLLIMKGQENLNQQWRTWCPRL